MQTLNKNRSIEPNAQEPERSLDAPRAARPPVPRIIQQFARHAVHVRGGGIAMYVLNDFQTWYLYELERQRSRGNHIAEVFLQTRRLGLRSFLLGRPLILCEMRKDEYAGRSVLYVFDSQDSKDKAVQLFARMLAKPIKGAWFKVERPTRYEIRVNESVSFVFMSAGDLEEDEGGYNFPPNLHTVAFFNAAFYGGSVEPVWEAALRLDPVEAYLCSVGSNGGRISTPEKNGFNREWVKAFRRGTLYTTPRAARFIPWFDRNCGACNSKTPLASQVPLKDRTPEEYQLVLNHGLEPDALRWRREKMATMGNLFPVEYPTTPEDAIGSLHSYKGLEG